VSGYTFPVIKWFDYKVHLDVIGINVMTKLWRLQISLIGFAKIQYNLGPKTNNFAPRHIEDALNLTLLNQQRHVEFGHSNRTSSTSELRRPF
jgi:hypothetical protein